MKPIVTGSLIAVTALSLTSNVLMYLRYSSSRPLVTVGSQVISKKDYQDALDYQTQGAVLKKLVLADLVSQAAAQARVMPSDAEVDARLADIQRRDPAQLPTYDPDGSKLALLRDEVRDDLALENLRLQGVTVTDAEVTDYYQRHAAAFTVPMQIQTEMVVTDNSVDAAQAASLLQQGIARDVIARQPRLHVVGQDGFRFNLQALPPALSRKISGIVFGMKAGAVTVIPAGQQYLILRVIKDDRSGIPPLTQIRPEVQRLAALDQATPADVEVARLYQQAKPVFAVAKYQDYFTELARTDTSTVRPARTASAQ